MRHFRLHGEKFISLPHAPLTTDIQIGLYIRSIILENWAGWYSTLVLNFYLFHRLFRIILVYISFFIINFTVKKRTKKIHISNHVVHTCMTYVGQNALTGTIHILRKYLKDRKVKNWQFLLICIRMTKAVDGLGTL